MPYHIDFDSTNRILRARFEGPAADDDLKDVYRFGREHVTRLDRLSGITDFSGVTRVAFSARTIRELALSKPIIQAGRSCSWRRRLISSGWRGCLSCKERKLVRTCTWFEAPRMRTRY